MRVETTLFAHPYHTYVVTSPGFLVFPVRVEKDADGNVPPIVLEDDPEPVEICEAWCGTDGACRDDGPGVDDGCVAGCLDDLRLVGTDEGDRCRPARVAHYDCRAALRCEDYLAMLDGSAPPEAPCMRVEAAIERCERSRPDAEEGSGG